MSEVTKEEREELRRECIRVTRPPRIGGAQFVHYLAHRTMKLLDDLDEMEREVERLGRFELEIVGVRSELRDAEGLWEGLERERDETRRALWRSEDWVEALAYRLRASEKALSANERAADEYHDECALLKRERDEAQAEVERLRGIIDHAGHPDRAGSYYDNGVDPPEPLLVYWWHDNYETCEEWRRVHRDAIGSSGETADKDEP